MGSSKTNQGKKLQLGLICRYRGKIKARKKGFLDPACEEKTDARKSASLLSGEKISANKHQSSQRYRGEEIKSLHARAASQNC
jgi:hypothetical protein